MSILDKEQMNSDSYGSGDSRLYKEREWDPDSSRAIFAHWSVRQKGFLPFHIPGLESLSPSKNCWVLPDTKGNVSPAHLTVWFGVGVGGEPIKLLNPSLFAVTITCRQKLPTLHLGQDLAGSQEDGNEVVGHTAL